MSQAHMAMAGMGGPVGGGPVGQPMNAGTPNSSVSMFTPDVMAKKLNTAIYEYLLCTEKYDIARMLKNALPIETADQIKQSPSQRGHQLNGVDNSMDVDNKEHIGIKNRPEDLPAPNPLHNEDSSFLQDWWFQFWEIYQGNRRNGRQNTLSYVGTQRQAQKGRQAMMNGMDPAAMQNMRYGNVMNNNMDLRQAAMKNVKGGMNPQVMQHMRNMQAQQQGQQMQANQMERQGSQMDMNAGRTGSPHSGDAPSPKRQRVDGSAPQMNQARPGQPGQLAGNQVGPLFNTPPTPDRVPTPIRSLLLSKGLSPDDIERMSREQLQRMSASNPDQQIKSVEIYTNAIAKQMNNAMQSSVSNLDKGMPPNAAMGPAGTQSSPMTQQGMDATANDFYNNNNANRMAMQQNGAVAAGQQGAQGNGNHALQDYQMQLMLLEQQNKKRLLMARQEQDSMTHQGGVPGPNGGRGSPNPGMMDPNVNSNLRTQMVMGPNGQPMMRPPSSHPMGSTLTQQQQMELMRQNGVNGMISNGNWQGGIPPQPGQMMPGQPGQPGQPPNMTPRSVNMPPPPAPPAANAGGTQPSSPAQPAAPPTPNAAAKAKGPNKKDTKASKAAAKKGGANAAANDDNPAPAQTPPPPVTPGAAGSFAQNKNMAMTNGQANANAQGGQNNQNAGAVQPPSADLESFAGLNGGDQYGNMTNLEFADLGSGDVLEQFDFDSFLNSSNDDGLGFDANIMFGDGPIEADGIGN